MNKTDSENKDTSGSIKSSFRVIVIEVAVVVIALSLTIVYHRFAEHLTILELVVLAIAVIVLWLL